MEEIDTGGIRLAYRLSGPASAPPLVLLHALGEDSSGWEEIASALAKSWRVYSVDLRGHGRSDWPGTYSIQLMADDMLRFLDALGLDRIALAGHSMGGVVSYVLASQHPERIARLVLEDPAPPWPRPPRFPARPDGPLSFDWAATSMAPEVNDPPPYWRDDLTAISAPTLLIAGGPASHINQDHLARLAALIPSCGLITIPAGHYVHNTSPAEFTDAVVTFLSRP
jgi:3-oxoadipate enol-lactonase